MNIIIVYTVYTIYKTYHCISYEYGKIACLGVNKQIIIIIIIIFFILSKTDYRGEFRKFMNINFLNS